jgi:1-acyl-sn-glycerol-3-phosphate acyltransferase
MYSISPGLFGIIANSSQLEWLDLFAICAAFLLYLFGLILFPRFFAQPLIWLLTHTIYRVRIFDRDKVPAEGPALIVCNHVSYVDWLFVWAACPRKVRFVGWAGFAKYRLISWVFQITNTIPIDMRASPKAILRTLDSIAEALDAGEVICIFPEATLTRT